MCVCAGSFVVAVLAFVYVRSYSMCEGTGVCAQGTKGHSAPYNSITDGCCEWLWQWKRVSSHSIQMYSEWPYKHSGTKTGPLPSRSLWHTLSILTQPLRGTKSCFLSQEYIKGQEYTV